ncbi:MAG: ROK family protein [Deltaproteobacteria bacterium]|nr:ROK family protein [Deltaproteobacteria bacterium]
MKKLAIGIDMGGTNIRLALISSDGLAINSLRYKTSAQEGKDAVISRLSSATAEMIAEGRKHGMVIGIGIGAPGLIENGVVRFSPNLPGWKEVPLQNLLEEALSLPVVLENDANAVAYGENSFGAGKGLSSLICITLGTGVGGGLILDGKIWRGAFGMAGEVGHIVVEPDGNKCSCGNRGCLETYASATGIVRTARDTVNRGDASWDTGNLTTETLEGAARGGDKAAASLFAGAGRYLGIGISSLLHILNPEAVIIGGGVARAWDLFYPSLSEEIKQRCFKEIAERTKIMPASLGDNAGILGAARLAFEQSAVSSQPSSV